MDPILPVVQMIQPGDPRRSMGRKAVNAMLYQYMGQLHEFGLSQKMSEQSSQNRLGLLRFWQK